MTRRIDTGNGWADKMSFDGPPIIRKVRIKQIGKNRGKNKKSNDRICDEPKGFFSETDRYWRALREAQYAQFRNKPGFKSFRRTGIPNGCLKPDAERQWAEAREKAIKALFRMIENGMI